MYGLRTLKITVYDSREFNIPKMLTQNAALENLLLDVENPAVELGKEMSGPLPCKLSNITITGRGMKYLSPYLLNVSIMLHLKSIFLLLQVLFGSKLSFLFRVSTLKF